MHTVFIRFLTQDDRVRGFYELATRAHISSLPGEVYQVPLEASACLKTNTSPTDGPRTPR